MGKDSVALDDAISAAGGRPAFGAWQGLLLFVVVLVCLSDFYVNTVVSNVPGAVEGRDPTDTGNLVQALSVVLLYMCANWLCDEGVL